MHIFFKKQVVDFFVFWQFSTIFHIFTAKLCDRMFESASNVFVSPLVLATVRLWPKVRRLQFLAVSELESWIGVCIFCKCSVCVSKLG